MPTKPHKISLDEAVEASTWRGKPITRKRATVAGILGIIFGFSGLHNLIMHRKKRAAGHFITSSIAFAMFVYPFAYGVAVVYCNNHIDTFKNCPNVTEGGLDTTLNIVMTIGLVLSISALLWGIIEGIIILVHRNRFDH